MIKVQINKICAKLIECEPLTSGMIGKQIELSFSEDWQGLNKIAVFSNGDTTKDVLESQWSGNVVTIPHEVLATPHRSISMGIYGYEIVDGEKVLAIPTIVAEIGKTKFGADPSDDPAADPTLPIWAQLQWEIDNFEVDPEIIAEQVQLYLDEHPIEIQPATASVLGGVKVGDGLSVTADGTLSADVTADDLDDLADIVDGKADAADIPSLDGYATESYVQNYHDNTKQDTITDLASIRSGAALGATALQSVPSTYRTASAQDVIDNGKQDKLIAGANITIAADGKTISATGGGGGAAIFEITVTEQGGSFTYSPTFAEIQAAITAGKVVVVNYNTGQYQYYWQTTNLIHFERVFEDDGLIFRRSIDIYSNGTAFVDTYQLNIPAVNNGVLTIKQGGVTKGTFSANSSSNTTINLDAGGGAALPETTALLKGDGEGGAVAAEEGVDYVTPDALEDYALKSDLPQNVSELTNDSGYLTLATLPIYDGSVV